MKRYLVHDLQGANFMDYSYPFGLTASEIRALRWSDYQDNFMDDPRNKMRWNSFTLDFIADFWELEFEPIKDVEIPAANSIKSADEARELAMDWQRWQSDQSLYMSELADWQGLFEQLAEKFNLTEEFEENAII